METGAIVGAASKRRDRGRLGACLEIPLVSSTSNAQAESLPASSERTRTQTQDRDRVKFWGALAAHPEYRRFWFSMLASSAGQWMQQVALGWLALSLTNSPGFVGMVTFAGGVPFLLVAPIGGSLIDRLDRRKMMLACQATATVLAIVVSLDIILGHVQPFHLMIAAVLNGSLQALLSPTQQSLVPSLVTREYLTNAVGLMGAGQNMTRVVGPSIAGMVIALFGVGPTFLVQAAMLLIAFFLVLGVNLPPRAPRIAGNRGALEGVRLVFSRPDIRGLFLLAAVPMFFIFPYIWFLNVFAKDIFHIGASGLGSMMAVSGMGAVVGSLGIASARRIEGMGRWLVGMSLIYGFVVLGVTISRSLIVTYPLLFMGSLLGSAFMSGNTVLVQHAIDDEVRGRVMGAYMLTSGLMPLGALPMGLAANQIGTPHAIAIGAMISTLLVAVVAIKSPVVRKL